MAKELRNSIAVPRQDLNLSIIHRDTAHGIISGTFIGDIFKKSKVQATALAFLFFDAREVCRCAVGKEEEEGTGIVEVGCSGRDVEVEECGVDGRDGRTEFITKCLVRSIRRGWYNEVRELEDAR